MPVKSVPQQVLVTLHRFRSGWLAARTTHINTLRGLLRELGFVIPLGAEKVLPQVRVLIGDADSGIPKALRPVLAACSVLCHAKKATEHDRLRTWALDLERRVGHNKAAVALANKLARIAWALPTSAQHPDHLRAGGSEDGARSSGASSLGGAPSTCQSLSRRKTAPYTRLSTNAPLAPQSDPQ